MENKVLKPKIRFKGFTDTWEQRKLNDVYTFSQGMQVEIENQAFDKKDNMEQFLRIIDITQSNEPPRYIYNKSGKGHVEKDDIFFVRYGAVGTIGYGYTGTIANNLFKLSTSEKYDNNFMFQQFSNGNFNKKLVEMSASTSMPAINFTALKNLDFFITTNDEQKEIGSFFSKLDNLITLHQSKYDKLVNVKKALLEKMFPKEGKNVPEIRFKGFTDTWEQRKLGEIYKFQYGEFNNNPSNGGIYPVYGANGIIGGYTNYNAENSVIIGHMGEYAGSVLWGNGKHFVTYNGTISKPKGENVASKFGYYMLYQKDINKICGGSGLPFLSYEQLNKIEVCYPKDIKEQKSIANYLTNIDNLITLHQHKLEKLQNIKKSLLNKMFV